MKLLILSVLIFILSCGSSTSIQKPNTENKKDNYKKDIAREDNKDEFSVVPYDKDDLTFPTVTNLRSEAKEEEKTKITKPGYRIQVESFKDFSMFRNFIQKLKTEISEKEYVVYDNIFHSPYFKVRVGDFETRDEAKQALPLFLELGYKGAYPVKDNIIVYE